MLCLCLPAWAQFRVEVTGVGLTQVPIAVASFPGDDSAPEDRHHRAGRLGAQWPVSSDRCGGRSARRKRSPRYVGWRQKNADALVTGSITKLADGRFDVRVRLWTLCAAKSWVARSYAVTPADVRLAAHRVADFVCEKLTGEKGVFSTRIAYVTKAGSSYNLWVADADGENAQSALRSAEPSSPRPGAQRQPVGLRVVRVAQACDLRARCSHGQAPSGRQLQGSNSAPAWSPDGKTIAATLTRDGGSQLYALDPVNGGEPRRLAQSGSIDTEPTFTQDGKGMYFVSDRGRCRRFIACPPAAAAPSALRLPALTTFHLRPAPMDAGWSIFRG